MSFKSALLAVVALLAAAGQSHIIMQSPVPYSVDKIDNGPLTAAQFPCKQQNGFTVSKMNEMKVGEKQQISFKGTAVHGGGSCQLSVTTDKEPNANSVFKVVKSIEGGCPGVSGVNTYDFELPDSIPNGDLTFAWTWMPKLSGQPEYYMNCAPIRVTGGAEDTSKFNQLPDMFVANINDCKTPVSKAVKFPNPGTVVEDGGTNDLAPPTGNCPAPGGVFAPLPSSEPTTLVTKPIPTPTSAHWRREYMQ
ncbi:hypothetical protein GQ43DRAFT_436661 [Delitschia confertaspora ATCC 74209]|uniref:Lytic polysaccharide monooxygenase n=1 Tax=Delitschia confertaspora ATCC 74209 TaxID=1513339 RepID=A0A9P4MWM4_9PLEO|nr:hypothetical protein GQ43DRAFT_436661 [Delitschia confertaspora ATCC 74209]